MELIIKQESFAIQFPHFRFFAEKIINKNYVLKKYLNQEANDFFKQLYSRLYIENKLKFWALKTKTDTENQHLFADYLAQIIPAIFKHQIKTLTPDFASIFERTFSADNPTKNNQELYNDATFYSKFSKKIPNLKEELKIWFSKIDYTKQIVESCSSYFSDFSSSPKTIIIPPLLSTDNILDRSTFNNYILTDSLNEIKNSLDNLDGQFSLLKIQADQNTDDIFEIKNTEIPQLQNEINEINDQLDNDFILAFQNKNKLHESYFSFIENKINVINFRNNNLNTLSKTAVFAINENYNNVINNANNINSILEILENLNNELYLTIDNFGEISENVDVILDFSEIKNNYGILIYDDNNKTFSTSQNLDLQNLTIRINSENSGKRKDVNLILKNFDTEEIIAQFLQSTDNFGAIIWSEKVNLVADINYQIIINVSSDSGKFNIISGFCEILGSKTQPTAIAKTSELIDDSISLPNSGINPWKIQTDQNKNSLLEKIDKFQEKTELHDSYFDIFEEKIIPKNFKNETLTIGHGDALSAINALKEEIDNLKLQITATQLPVGAKLISIKKPSYGIWTDLGEILEGQTIIGGGTTNGMFQRHSHKSLSQVIGTTSAKGNQSYDVIAQFTMYDSNNNPLPISPNSIHETHKKDIIGYTTSEGTDDKNRAWGLGIGLGNHIWRRDS